ncbi:MAG: hypothetical protein LBI33_14110 [Propionibacteriaceae bacterium]|nr:hypothetical protein [Propionibacteriaceae bacterium]
METSIARFRAGAEPLTAALRPDGLTRVRLLRIGEFLQRDVESLETLTEAGIRPGVEVEASTDQACLTLFTPTHECRLDADWAEQLFVSVV